MLLYLCPSLSRKNETVDLFPIMPSSLYSHHAEIFIYVKRLKSLNPKTEGPVGGQTNSEAPNPKLCSTKSIFTSYRPKTLNLKALRGLLKDAQGTLDLHELSPGAAAAAVSGYPEDGVPNLSGFSFAWV